MLVGSDPVRMPTLWRLLALALGGYGLLCLLVVLLERKLMYFPRRAPEAEAQREAQSLGLAPWRDPHGALLGWRAPRPASAVRVLVFHGNAGSALDRGYYLTLLRDPGADVILFEYPGYGARTGVPSQESLVEGAAQALAQLRGEDPGPIWLLGESLGSGVACALAARRPKDIAGLVLVTPFARMTDVAAWHYPYLPVRLLLRDRWDNVAALALYPGPVGMFIAGRDEVVGAGQGRLLAASLGPRARLWEQPEAGHNSFSTRPEGSPWPEIREFLRASTLHP
jgi:pimeloyl-ACP methyl ester carboxylesterase